jgi:hypothetical protein
MLTEDQLKAIELRCNGPWAHQAHQIVEWDVPALIDEIRRLRKVVASYEDKINKIDDKIIQRWK